MLWLIGIALIAAHYVGPYTFQTVAILSLCFILYVALGLGVGIRAMEEKEI